ncbi:MAG: Uma2 family endonuclease [Caldilineaceae bacterium]|nr:Uma2 family endonuclease [Caldilineaceae bacterium]
MAGVAVRERPPATRTHDRDTVPAIDSADPDMTQAARLARAAWRREHLAEWQRELEVLCHFDPEFIYDPAHEYDQESTTDPDYDADEIHFVEFDADGVVRPLEKRARKVQERGADTASDMLADTGLEGDYERLVRFRPETIEHANQTTRASHPVRKGVRPDMLVRAVMSPSERERFMPDGFLRLDLGAPVPPLVLEVVSEGSAERDLNYKRHLYAAAGVSEYLVYDLGGKRGSGSPRALLMYRLGGGSYRQVPVADEYRSAVFNTRVRMMPDAQERSEEQRGVPEEDRSPPRFQWWDPDTERWRDRESDLKLEVKLEGVQEGRVQILIQALDAFLPDLSDADRERIVEAWSADGIPDDMLSWIMEAGQTPDEWESIVDVS